MKISCDKAAEICTKSQYEEASWWQIVKLKLHILYCKTCAQFSAKNTKFTSLCEQGKVQVMPENEKELMKDAIKKKL